MKNVLLQTAEKLNNNRKKRKWWHNGVRATAAVVVFCTTYALILPAITMEADPICGMKEHIHTESCFAQTDVTEIICGQSGVAHSHNEFCYDQAGSLICALPEIPAHTHVESCYGTRQVIICQLPEEAHVHGENCYTTNQTLTCQDTAEDHVHGESCYTSEQVLVCQESTEAHVHGEGCSVTETVLICGQEELAEHIHSEECRTVTTTVTQVCTLDEHRHEPDCYPEEEMPETVPVSSEYLCGMAVHAHTEGCYDEAGALHCTIPVHDHEAACMVADLDLNADVETASMWEETIQQLIFTGNWPTDVLTVATSQLDYQESEKNVILKDDMLKGYTRYGAWYGDPYGDWCAMFASFCLHYAGVEDFPLAAGCGTWIEALTESGQYAVPADYTPKPGDLIFFDVDRKPDAVEAIAVEVDHVGLVAELIPATETEPAMIKTIEGNSSNKVEYKTYQQNDLTIIGYGILPAGPVTILTNQGVDYTVTVKFGEEAQIPQNTQLEVREILPGTDEYQIYYQQSVEALLSTNVTQDTDDPNISFARFFDISFVADGQIVEPAAPVNVQIRYAESFTVKQGNTGLVVHFADEGTEVLDADTNDGEVEQADTFEFIQGSFSVSGTLVAANARAAANVAHKINFDQLKGDGSTEYVIYTYYNNQYYALGAPADGKTGVMVPLTVSADGTVTWSSGNVRWTFESTGTNTYNITNEISTSSKGRHLHVFYNGNGSDIGVIGTNSKGAMLIGSGSGADATFTIKHPTNTAYATISGNVFTATNNAWQARNFYIAVVQPSEYHVWFDGTDGGMMSYYYNDGTKGDVYQAVDSANNIITLPETWPSPTKYEYQLNGWYNINTHTYHKPGEQVSINQNSVFYADWVAATYDVGIEDEHTVKSLDTNDFITTYVFDYNVLFNVLSQSHTGTITASDHSETWRIYNNGETVPYQNGKSLGFAFVDYDSDGEFSYALDRDTTNINQGSAVTVGILNEVYQASGQDLLDLLFNPKTKVIGKNYVGEGNYLFQYMDSTTENYDGEHDGYYYLDARLNAASYNQTYERFYLYDYLERTSDSRKDGHVNQVGQYSDLLPFNSPYLFEEHQLDYYTDTVMQPGWEYDAKDGAYSYQDYNSADDAATNYFFGIRTDIEFFLPNDAGTQDEYNNYGNISTRGEHMVFDFHGDDDVWVFVDGELVLDIGGLHGIMHGKIDFSTGTVTTGRDGSESTKTFQQILGHNITEGTHTMQIYYMERGSSQSNCAIYFNIAPRYDLEITKEDIVNANKLDGAVFTIYNDEAMTSPAQLWDSEEAYLADMADGEINDAKSSFTVTGGVAKCWGISAGKTYYIYETIPPPGYPESDDLIRITLNNRGTATIETTILHGSTGVATEGFAVIKQEVNDTLKIVALTVTNQKDSDTTEVRVEKSWAEGSTNLPQSITVYLTADGERIGRTATLHEGNGWSYTWTGLPKYREKGIDQEIVYVVQEVLVPGYITTQGATEKVVDYVDWIRVDQMSDSKTFILVHNGQALTYNGSFGWMDPATAELDTSLSAQWNVTTNHDGFRLKNGLGYTLTFNGTNSFYGIDNDDVKRNQVVYYLNSRLVAHDHDVYFQFSSNGTAVAEDGLAFTLYQKEVFTGFLTGITNVPVEEEDQTYVEVTKEWNDGNDLHTDDAVTIRLYADGRDTGRYVILNAANNWTGGFYELPYFQEDGVTVVTYTVVEDAMMNYLPDYSEPLEIPGLPVTLWQDTETLTAGSIYRFISGSHALAVDPDTDNAVVSAFSDLQDTYQQWQAVNYNGSIILRNVGSQLYLVQNGQSLSVSNVQGYAAVVSMENGYVKLGWRYLELTASHAGATNNIANVTNQTVAVMVETTGKPGTAYTVKNLRTIYELPQTGGAGTTPFEIGGLLILSTALIYICTTGRKRRKGGRRV